MKSKPAYIVIDTNVLISAGLLPNSKSAQVLAMAVEQFVIAQNDSTWHELETRIARQKFDRYFEKDGRLKHLIQMKLTTSSLNWPLTLSQTSSFQVTQT